MDYKYILRKRGQKPEADTSIASVSVARKVRTFHQTIPGYTPTPLVSLHGMANEVGIGQLYVKDESFRFGLKAFKALGGSYAVANILAEKMGVSLEDLAF